ncbi:N-acetylneuraminate lyase [Paraburkholderia dipogonis]|uniref:N-acetylneuraminate lyase n=1 Tax=Paraburkholderia dipogonis TaxID=1211383 RepID=A0A4Y8MHJ8_9BURK|nr:N-acetylneuraminate lyase [Paraburkholderia dipogonis]TFE36864.1 N-acetylneuraminate lyase [Paraburkholderia dipogonis]
MSNQSVDSKSSSTAVSRLSKLHAALLTPYDAKDKVSVRCLHRLVAHVKQQGIEGFYVGGSTGEGLLQSIEERQTIFAEVAEAAAGSALIGHVGAISTRDAQTLAKSCAALGYDAVSAIPPIYFSHKKDAVIGYYKDIIEAAGGTPLIVYNIPAMSGVTFTLDDLGRLLELPGVIGIKQTSIDMYQMEQLSRIFPGKLLLNGYDEMLLAGLVSGAKGGVGSTYNVMGARYLELAAKAKAGDIGGAAKIQSQCNAVIDELVRVSVFPGMKYLLYRQGVIETPMCRRPLVTLSSDTAGRLDEIAAELSR